MEEYVETEMSKRARKRFLEKASEGSYEKVRYERGSYDYDFEKKKRFMNGEEFDAKMMYHTLLEGVSYLDDTLERLCFQFNLNDKELNDLIKMRFRDCYGPENIFSKDKDGLESGIELTKSHYPKWCKDWGIEPDPNFPNW